MLFVGFDMGFLGHIENKEMFFFQIQMTNNKGEIILLLFRFGTGHL